MSKSPALSLSLSQKNIWKEILSQNVSVNKQKSLKKTKNESVT